MYYMGEPKSEIICCLWTLKSANFFVGGGYDFDDLNGVFTSK